MKNSLYYVKKTTNFGDAINPYIFQKVLGLNISFEKYYNANIFGIGSILQKAFILNKDNNFFGNLWRNKNKYIQNYKNKNKKLVIYGSGFIDDFSNQIHQFKNNNYLALRGKKSLSIINKLPGGLEYNPVLGDPGLLVDRLIHKSFVKKYEIGFIPHYIDQHLFESKLIRSNSKIKFINILDNPMDILYQISSCETIISSALHGLIAADSLGIPNRWIKLSDNLMGGDFKFHDYYSVYDIDIEPLDLRKIDNFVINKNNILDSYCVNVEKVMKIKNDLLEVAKDNFD